MIACKISCIIGKQPITLRGAGREPVTPELPMVCTPGGYYSAATSLPGFGVRRGAHGTGQGRRAGFTH